MNFEDHIDIHNESFSEILKIAIVQLLLLFEYLATMQILKEYYIFLIILQ